MRRFNIWWNGPCCIPPNDCCCCKPYISPWKGVGSYFGTAAGAPSEPNYGFPCCDCCSNAWNGGDCGRFVTTYRTQFKDRNELRMFPHLKKPCSMGFCCF